MDETLREILERCRNGDEKAAATLIERFHRWALDLARALTRESALAEDVVQESFIIALQGLENLRSADAFPGWLQQILRRQAYRINGKHRDTVSSDIENIPAASARPDERFEREELRTMVREALDKLPAVERDTAVRFYIEQQRCIEIAQALCIPPGTVRRRLFDARQRLHSMLLEYMDDGMSERHLNSTTEDLPL